MQGITVAAQSAIALSSCLREVFEHDKNTYPIKTLSKQYMRELYKSLNNSWNMTIASDLRFGSTVTSANISNGQVHKFDRMITDCLLGSAQQDNMLYLKLLEVAHLTRPPKDLLIDVMKNWCRS
jgi:hypothetical protein